MLVLLYLYIVMGKPPQIIPIPTLSHFSLTTLLQRKELTHPKHVTETRLVFLICWLPRTKLWL